MLDNDFLLTRSWDGRAPGDLSAVRSLRADNLLRIGARSHPTKEAVRFEGRSLDYAELDTLVNRAASGLIALGAKLGDVVAVMADNSPEVLALMYGLVRAGLSTLPLNPRLAKPEIEFQLKDANAMFAVGPDGLSLDEVLSKGSDDDVQIEFDENLFYHVRFTGGTTGTPKCIAATHRAIALLQERIARELNYHRDDICLMVAPIAHVAFHLAAATLVAGGTISLHRTFDARTLWEQCDSEGLTTALLVPTMLAMALESPGTAHSLKKIFVTSSTLPPAVKVRLRERFPRLDVYESYGASDLGFVTLAVPGDPPEKFGSVGRAAFGAEVRVLDESGRECSTGEIGGIYSRSAIHSFGYLGSIPMKPNQAFGDWVSVGDLGYRDADGYFYIVDRREDLIVSGGYNVYPSEVEDVLLSHEGVEEAAVVGISDPKWGKAVVAAVKGTATAEQLNAHCRAHLADYKAPKHYEFLTELPKSPVMKIMRRQIREQIEAKLAP
jgi:acyl-CoA synthetase (AMP-forming)/AMP-acid ligase II